MNIQQGSSVIKRLLVLVVSKEQPVCADQRSEQYYASKEIKENLNFDNRKHELLSFLVLVTFLEEKGKDLICLCRIAEALHSSLLWRTRTNSETLASASPEFPKHVLSTQTSVRQSRSRTLSSGTSTFLRRLKHEPTSGVIHYGFLLQS